MAVDVILPELGEGVTEGELIKWLVKPGDSVKADQPVAEVMTDKATVEVPTPVPGVVKELLFKAGEIIKVEKVILRLDGAGASATSSGGAGHSAGATHAASAAPTAAASSSAAAAVFSSKTSSTSNGNGSRLSMGASATTSSATTTAGIYPPVADFRTLATPATRRLARESGVDINGLKGTGLAGRVTREDVMMAAGGMEVIHSGSPAKSKISTEIPRMAYQSNRGAQEERVAIRGIRKKIAENMQMSKHIIPHFTLMDEAVVTELVAMRESLKEYAEKNQTKITYLPFVMKALISTCREFPMLNASIDDAAQEIVYKKYFNIGFAADTPNGLVVPVIKDADMKSTLEISREIVDLSKRARDGKLKPDEMKGASITITNIGSVGGTYATPIINHPEVAILGMYKISDRLYLDPTGAVKSQKVMNFTITADHRLIDGAVAANFLKAFIGRIQQPGRLLMDLA